MTHSESWNTFIDELRAYVQEHHHFPNKHTRLLSKVKYTRILRQAQEPFFDKITNLLRQAQEPIINMKGYTYILQVSDGRYYVGSTENLEKRLAEHQRGEGAMFTKAYLPVKLVYTEEHERVEDAFRREKQLQKWSHAKKEALIKGDITTLKLLSKSKG